MLGIFDAVMGTVKPILDKFIPDAKDRLEAEQLIANQLHAVNMGQIEINKQEAKSDKLFVAGWRPFVGWTCAGTFAYSVVIRDFLNWGMNVITTYSGHILPVLPNPDTTLTFEILMALLGFGGLRTYEKFKGVAR